MQRQRWRWAQPPPPSPLPLVNPPTNDSSNPSPHPLRRNRDDYDKSGGCRFQGSVEAELLLLGERKCYRKGRAEALLEGAAAGVRERAAYYYFRGSGSGSEGTGESATAGGDGRRRGATAGSLLPSGDVTRGADRRHDDRCYDRRGTRKSHGMIATKRN